MAAVEHGGQLRCRFHREEASRAGGLPSEGRCPLAAVQGHRPPWVPAAGGRMEGYGTRNRIPGKGTSFPTPMERRDVGLVCCVTQVIEPSALIVKRKEKGVRPGVPGLIGSILHPAPCKPLHGAMLKGVGIIIQT